MQPGSVIIGTTSEQAYDPSPDLYDYAQTKAATMNYVKSLAKQLGPKGFRAARASHKKTSSIRLEVEVRLAKPSQLQSGKGLADGTLGNGSKDYVI